MSMSRATSPRNVPRDLARSVWLCAALIRLLLAGSSFHVPLWSTRILVPVVPAIVFAETLLVAFVADVSMLGVIPIGGTVDRFAKLLHDVSYSITWPDVPATADSPILFLLASGVGVLALLSDIATFSLRLPALAGVPLLVLFLVPSMPPEGTTDGGFFVLTGIGAIWACFSQGAHDALWRPW